MSLLYRPSELAKLGLRAKKALSQNFLIDRNIIEKFCTAACITENDPVVEIGPGPGAITEKLLEKKAHVIAIEKDPALAEGLHRFQNPNLEIHCADALAFPLEKLPAPCKVVGSLPYHITTPLITKFIHSYPKITSLTVIVQREVGQRMTAKKNTSEYSHFSLFLQAYSKPKYCCTIKPTSFSPVPSVHSCLIHMPLHPFPFSFSQEAFFQMTRRAFNQRRKMLRRSLKGLYTQDVLEKSFEQANILPTTRPQELSLEEFALFFEECEKNQTQAG